MNFELVDTILYEGEEGSESTKLYVNKQDCSMWATQKIIAKLFNVNKSTISRHLKIFLNMGNWRIFSCCKFCNNCLRC